MDALVVAAENVLRRTAAPALRLSELLQGVRADTGVSSLEAPRLRATLEAHPGLFRILDPWRGPWRLMRGGSTSVAGPGDARAEPWVVVVGDPGAEGGTEPLSPRLERRLRRSVRWLGVCLDAGSGSAVARWHALAIAEGAARAALRRAA